MELKTVRGPMGVEYYIGVIGDILPLFPAEYTLNGTKVPSMNKAIFLCQEISGSLSTKR